MATWPRTDGTFVGKVGKVGTLRVKSVLFEAAKAIASSMKVECCSNKATRNMKRFPCISHILRLPLHRLAKRVAQAFATFASVLLIVSLFLELNITEHV